MNATGRMRMWTGIVLWTLLLTTAPGCGQMARQAFKEGLFNYVSGSVGSGLISAQLADLVANLIATGGTLFR